MISTLKPAAYLPSDQFAANAKVSSFKSYTKLCQKASQNLEDFWAGIAKQLHWFTPWTQVLDWSNPPFARWFVGGTTNLCYNALDRHLRTRVQKVALIWEPENGEAQTFTYAELHAQVCRCANALEVLGVKAGDRVLIYLPMIPEIAVTMLACLRIGAVHSVVFAAFSGEAVKERVHDCGAKWIVTADGGWRRGQSSPLKANVDSVIQECPMVEKVIVVRRTGEAITMQAGRDIEWEEFLRGHSSKHQAAKLDAEANAFILYTSGTTGKPKGIMHTTGGYMAYIAYTATHVFDLNDEDRFWCTADAGWITGHSYTLYAILLNGGTTLMYEGAINFPDCDRVWSIIEKHRITIFYTAPTAIRTFIKWGDHYPNSHDLSSLRLLGTVGESINPAAWMWYHAVIGKRRCPIVDTWWQTETGGIMISPLPGATPTKPGSATLPLPGIEVDVVNDLGESCAPDVPGFLVIKKPWPAMLRGIWGDPERFIKTYYGKYSAQMWYCPMDGAVKDSDGYIWIRGRVDDIIIVSGHNIGSAEIESALVSHLSVAESAVVGIPDEVTGNALVAFVTIKNNVDHTTGLADALRQHCATKLGAHAKPAQIRFTDTLPKTRSGKIMRRLLRDVATGRQLGDTTTLESFDMLKALYEDKEG